MPTEPNGDGNAVAADAPATAVRETTAEESEPVRLGDVESELSRRISRLQTSPQDVVLPARMSNLVIYCDTPELVRDVGALIPRITELHPARVILLHAQPNAAGSDLKATVTVRTHPVRDERAFCSEQIDLYAEGIAVQKLPFVVWSLVIGDLPVNLWWASAVPPPLGGELFHQLAEDADQVVFDSIGWRDPPRGMAAVVNWIQQIENAARTSRWRLAADLNWRRLKYWRRLVSQALDPGVAPGLLTSINEVVLEHGPHAVIQAWEMASWLGVRLGWHVQSGKVQPGVEMAWQFRAAHGAVRVRVIRHQDGRPALARLRIAGPEQALSFVVGSERRLAVFEEGQRTAPRTVTVPPLTTADLVGAELSDRQRDPIFRASLQVAWELAQSVLH